MQGIRERIRFDSDFSGLYSVGFWCIKGLSRLTLPFLARRAQITARRMPDFKPCRDRNLRFAFR